MASEENVVTILGVPETAFSRNVRKLGCRSSSGFYSKIGGCAVCSPAFAFVSYVGSVVVA
jgi:hypothetical protein